MLCFYQGTQKIPPLRRWWTDKGCFWAENSKSQQRICCKDPTSSRAYGSMISTSQIFPIGLSPSCCSFRLQSAPFLGRSRCKRLQQLTSPLMCEADNASSFPCLMASLLTCTTALRAHWWLVLSSFHHLLYASVIKQTVKSPPKKTDSSNQICRHKTLNPGSVKITKSTMPSLFSFFWTSTSTQQTCKRQDEELPSWRFDRVFMEDFNRSFWQSLPTSKIPTNAYFMTLPGQ